jgi:DNA-binding transcriptional LysR family regulator
MEFRQVRTFQVVAQEGSFTRAAQALHYAQSTVTTQIKCLETAVGACLLIRHGSRAVELTAAGRVMLTSGERLIDLVDVTVQEIRAVNDSR